MILVELYSKNDCHLCEVVKENLLKAQKSHPFELKEIKIHEGHEHFEQYKERIPVVFINKEFAFQHRVSEEALLKRLQAETKG